MWTIIRQSLNKKEWKLLELQITQTLHPKVFRTDGQMDGQTDRRTDGRPDGRSGPTTRPAFAKATQVKMVWPFDPTPWVEGVCGQNICYHVAAKVDSFNLICSMFIFWKSLILALAPPPKSIPQARTHAFKLKSRLICFISITALTACAIPSKILTIALVIAKFKYLTVDPLGGV